MLKAVRLYGLIAGFILVWWYLAFGHMVTSTPTIALQAQTVPSPSSRFRLLPPLSRDQIKEGLDGNIATMIHAISEWNNEALILKESGLADVQQVSPEDYQRVQWLGRQLLSQPAQKTGRFLPQTCVSASFLLALVETDQIVALPKIVREQTHIYPSTRTKQIALDIDRYQAEALYQAKPDIAFVAPYSHPATIAALKNQGMQIVSHGELRSLEDVFTALRTIGQTAQVDQKAWIMQQFMHAALIAIDNRVLAYHADHLPEKILFLNQNMHYSHPNRATLAGELLDRLGLYPPKESALFQMHSGGEYSVPIDQEQLEAFNPDRLIVSVPGGKPIHSTQGAISYVDADIQQTPSQYIILAYHDLFDALTKPPGELQ